MSNDLFRDEQFEYQENIENEDDLNVDANDFKKLIAAPADWTVGTIYSQIGKQIDLNPDFQRRNVWSLKAKSSFIESLLLGIPIPQILLSDKSDKRGMFIVLDGKQRLLTIFEFLRGHLHDGKIFRLNELRILRDLNGKSWEDIKKIDGLESEFLNETVRTTIVKNWTTQGVLYEIFYRLNSGSVKLSPMELRMSLYPGDFLKFAINWTEKIGPLHTLLRRQTPDKRMADVELIVRHLAFMTKEIPYKGDLKGFLDDFCDYSNKNFHIIKSDYKNRLNLMNNAISLGIDIFSDRQFCKKFTPAGYEPRFNRALFDVLVGSLVDQDVFNFAKDNPRLFVETYEKLCLEDDDFIKSIESSTKSVERTKKRFSAWYSSVENISNLKLPLPIF